MVRYNIEWLRRVGCFIISSYSVNVPFQTANVIPWDRSLMYVTRKLEIARAKANTVVVLATNVRPAITITLHVNVSNIFYYLHNNDIYER